MDENELEQVGSKLGVINEDEGSINDNLTHDNLAQFESEVGDEEELRDDVTELESVKTQSIVSKRSGSTYSGRTYASKLERELNEERKAREKIESELEELKRVSRELSERLNSSGK